MFPKHACQHRHLGVDRIGGGVMTREEWRDIAGYEGHYQVSNLGRVKSLDRDIIMASGKKRHVCEKILFQSAVGDGYKTVGLKIRGKSKVFKVHRLVAGAFINNPDDMPNVIHINGVPDDNRASNLRWGSGQDTIDVRMINGNSRHSSDISNHIDSMTNDEPLELEGERWLPIPGYEGIYEVSSIGRIRRCYRVTSSGAHLRPKILKQCIGRHGYPCINLRKNGFIRKHTIHRLVASAFIPNPDNLPVVDHINSNKLDPRVENLRYCTYEENTGYAVKSGVMDIEERTKRITSESVQNKKIEASRKAVIREDGKRYPSLTHAAKDIGCTVSSISAMLNGKSKTVMGHTFRFDTE